MSTQLWTNEWQESVRFWNTPVHLSRHFHALRNCGLVRLSLGVHPARARRQNKTVTRNRAVAGCRWALFRLSRSRAIGGRPRLPLLIGRKRVMTCGESNREGQAADYYFDFTTTTDRKTLTISGMCSDTARTHTNARAHAPDSWLRLTR